MGLKIIAQIGGPALAVAVKTPYLYAGFGPRLAVLDITDPAQPRLLEQSRLLPGLVSDIVLEGSRMYVTAGGLVVSTWLTRLT